MSPERCDGIVLADGAGRRYGRPKALAEDGRRLRGAVAALRGGGCERIFVVLGVTGPAYRVADGGWLVSQTSGVAIPEGAQPVWAADWDTGVSASIRAGLAAAAAPGLSADGSGLGADGSGLSAEGSAASEIVDRRGDLVVATGTETARNTSVRNSDVRNIGTRSAGPGRVRPAEPVAIMPVDTPDVGADVAARVIAAARASESRLARAVFGGAPGHPVALGREHWAGACAAGNSGAGIYLRQRADMVCVTCDDLATGIDRDYPAGSAL